MLIFLHLLSVCVCVYFDVVQLYKGWLRDGSVVLVKCMKLKQKHSAQALHHHMEVISKLRHRHLVSVLGHCIVSYQDHPSTASTVFIVLENLSNSSLRDHLIGTFPSKTGYLKNRSFERVNAHLIRIPFCRLEKKGSAEMATENGHHHGRS